MKTILRKVLLAMVALVPVVASAQTIEEMADIFWNKSSCRKIGRAHV